MFSLADLNSHKIERTVPSAVIEEGGRGKVGGRRRDLGQIYVYAVGYAASYMLAPLQGCLHTHLAVV